MNIPETIEVDVTALDIGNSIHIQDLTAGAKFTFIGDPELTVVACVAPQKEEEAAPAEAAEGDTPAEGSPEASSDEKTEEKPE
jgi:large subunit ribosomal protein L25